MFDEGLFQEEDSGFKFMLVMAGYCLLPVAAMLLFGSFVANHTWIVSAWFVSINIACLIFASGDLNSGSSL